jgi:hypothetical protein
MVVMTNQALASTSNRCAASVTAVAVLLLSFAAANRAQAASCSTLLHTTTLIVEDGANCTTKGEQSIYLETGTATTVKGHIGTPKGLPIVDLVSSSLIHGANGQGISPFGTKTYQDLTVSVEPTSTSAFTFGAFGFGEKMLAAGHHSLTIEAFDDQQNSLGKLTLTPAELRHARHTNFLVMANSSDLIASVVIESLGFKQTGSFKIADLVDPPLSTDDPVAQAPIPAALPLFATGLGALGLLGWRRGRKTRTRSILPA